MELFFKVFAVLYVITIIWTVIVIFLENNTPLKAVSWTLAVILMPVLGILLYLNFGRKFRKEKIFNTKEIVDFMWLNELSIFQVESISELQDRLKPEVSNKLNIIKLLLNNSKSLLTFRNRVEVLNDGKEKFDQLLLDLEASTHSIHLEYYIFEADHIGTRIQEVLIKKARAGVKVRFIYDDVGSWHLTRKFIRAMKDAGVNVGCFMPVKFPLFAHKVNYRMHRKIVVIDGKIGYVGGINVADKYIEGDPDIGYWRDTHLRLEGHAVQSLQAVFLTDWQFVSGELADDHTLFETGSIESHQLVQITASGPDSEWASIMQAYFTAITTAEEHVFISTPYFLPNESILTAITTAALRGVKVKLLLPGKSDLNLLLWGSMSYVEELLEAGVEVYQYNRGFTHGKIMMVDGLFTSIGTANMDVRSFDKNFEINALIYDAGTARRLESDFLEDLNWSTQLHYKTFSDRSWVIRLKEALARVISPLL